MHIRNNIFALGALGSILVFGSVVIGCGDDDEDDDNGTNSETVSGVGGNGGSDTGTGYKAVGAGGTKVNKDNSTDGSGGISDSTAESAKGGTDRSTDGSGGISDSTTESAKGGTDRSTDGSGGISDSTAESAKGGTDRSTDGSGGISDSTADGTGGAKGGDSESFVPQSGTWQGTYAFMNVSSDGSKLTSSGSPRSNQNVKTGLPNYYCLSVSYRGSLPNGSGLTGVVYFYDDIPVVDGEFTTGRLTTGTFTRSVTGAFTSRTQCSGTVDVKDSDYIVVSGWNAVPSPATSALVAVVGSNDINPSNDSSTYDTKGRLVLQIDPE